MFNTSRYAHTARIYYAPRYCCRKRNVNFPECHYRRVLRGISGISMSFLRVVSSYPLILMIVLPNDGTHVLFSDRLSN